MSPNFLVPQQYVLIPRWNQTNTHPRLIAWRRISCLVKHVLYHHICHSLVFFMFGCIHRAHPQLSQILSRLGWCMFCWWNPFLAGPNPITIILGGGGSLAPCKIKHIKHAASAVLECVTCFASSLVFFTFGYFWLFPWGTPGTSSIIPKHSQEWGWATLNHFFGAVVCPLVHTK